jgi:hypothetical protein
MRLHPYTNRGQEMNMGKGAKSAFVCVYLRHLPTDSEWEKTSRAASTSTDLSLNVFLAEYKQDDRYYDWGDDPAFFAAQEFMDDVRRASWGVCRPNVRSCIKPGDLVIFFCGKPCVCDSKKWDYYYIGFGTVKVRVDDRWQIWKDDQFQDYRRFYNLLVRPEGATIIHHKEVFYPYHKDWQKRLGLDSVELPETLDQNVWAKSLKVAPKRLPAYILFDEDVQRTHFNLENPLHVATYRDGDKWPEVWNSDGLTPQLERVLFVEQGIARRLRTSPTGSAHQFIHLTLDDSDLNRLRGALLKLSQIIAGGEGHGI